MSTESTLEEIKAQDQYPYGCGPQGKFHFCAENIEEAPTTATGWLGLNCLSTATGDNRFPLEVLINPSMKQHCTIFKAIS